MSTIQGFDHIALAVPSVREEVERLTTLMGMVVEGQAEQYAVVADPASGFKIELSASPDGEAHFRHLGFRADDVDSAHEWLVEAGLMTTVAPERRDFARMRTSFLKEGSGVEIQLVKYDQEA